MKKLCTILAALTLVVLCFVLMPTEAKAASVDDLTFELTWDGEGYYVSGCNASASGDLVIPETYNGKPVVSIGVYAFWRCSNLTNITIPKTVSGIGSWAFRLCGNLQGIWVDEDNPYLSSDAHGVLFNKEKTLLYYAPGALSGDYTIPNGVTHIREDAFMYCGSVTSITIPASVTNIDKEVFGYCTSLTGFMVDEKNPAYSSDAYGVLYNKEKTELVMAPCKMIGVYTIPEGVTTIGANGFAECSRLTGLVVPKSVTYIGEYTFYNCTNLKNVYITDVAAWCKAQFMGGGANPLYYGADLYVNNKLLTNLVVPDGITEIRYGTFINCTSLTSVTIPDSVTKIGVIAFAGCTGLTEITIPGSVTTIGQEAFSGCTSLKSITIPESVTSIGEGTFYECSNLTKVNIPDGVTRIEGLTFCECESLTSITIPDSVTFIDYRAFESCTGLTSIIIPDGVTSLGNGVFGWCTNLTSITIPDSVTSIGRSAFYQCNSLTSIYIPQGVTTIGDSAFSMCYKLTNIELPDSVTCIESWAFSSCSGLTHVTIPDSVTNIGYYAFSYCYDLSDVTYCGTEEQWEQISIDGGNTWLTDTKRSYHNFADGVCAVCGLKNYPVDPNLKFASVPGISFKDYLALQIMFQNSVAKDYDSFYVEISQVTPDGMVTTTSTGIPFNSSYRYFEHKIVSWSMTDEVTMTLYGKKGDEIYVGQSFTTSVKQLAMEKLLTYEFEGDFARCRIFANMLNYGAAVQLAYDYNVENLPNVDLGDYAKYATTTTPAMNAVNSITGSGPVKIYKDNISLQDRVEFQFLVKTSDLNGKTVKATVANQTVDVTYLNVDGFTIIRVAVEPAHMRDTYTIGIYDASGNPASAIYNVSAEAYAKSLLTGATGAAYIAMMRYGDAVAEIA